jgi:hypothetical protein
MSDFESGAFNRALPPLHYLTYFVYTFYETIAQCRLRFKCSGVRFTVSLASTVDEAVYSRCLVLESEMRIAHYHLERPVLE